MKAKTSDSFCYCTQNTQQSAAGIHKISVFLLTTSPENLFAVECISKTRLYFCDKLLTCKHRKPREKLLGHTSQRNRKSRHIIDLAVEPTSREANGCLARHENCETIGSEKRS